MPPHTDHPDGVRAVLITTSVIELPIDIKTCTATLKVDITAQTVGKIAISIAAADITGNIPIDIKAQTVGKIGISIAATDITGNIPIDIKAQTVGKIGISIAAGDVTGNIAVDIKAQTVGKIGISIAAGDVTGNIAVDVKAQTIGNLTIEITAQTVGVYLNPEWQVVAGKQKQIAGVITDKAYGESGNIVAYGVPADKTLYIFSASIAVYATRDAEADFNQIGYASLLNGLLHVACLGGNGGSSISLTCPVKVVGSVQCGLDGYAYADHKINIRGVIQGIEV